MVNTLANFNYRREVERIKKSSFDKSKRLSLLGQAREKLLSELDIQKGSIVSVIRKKADMVCKVVGVSYNILLDSPEFLVVPCTEDGSVMRGGKTFLTTKLDLVQSN
jgi:hypothetical protein